MICGSCDGPPYALPVALDRRHGEKLAKETKLFACLTLARHDPLTSASFLAVYSCITVTVTATISKPLRQATCLFSAPTSCSFLSHFQEGGVCGVRGAENVEDCMCVSEGLLKQHLVATRLRQHLFFTFKRNNNWASISLVLLCCLFCLGVHV